MSLSVFPKLLDVVWRVSWGFLDWLLFLAYLWFSLVSLRVFGPLWSLMSLEYQISWLLFGPVIDVLLFLYD